MDKWINRCVHGHMHCERKLQTGDSIIAVAKERFCGCLPANEKTRDNGTDVYSLWSFLYPSCHFTLLRCRCPQHLALLPYCQGPRFTPTQNHRQSYIPVQTVSIQNHTCFTHPDRVSPEIQSLSFIPYMCRLCSSLGSLVGCFTH
jgi:hypothetical protein